MRGGVAISAACAKPACAKPACKTSRQNLQAKPTRNPAIGEIPPTVQEVIDRRVLVNCLPIVENIAESIAENIGADAKPDMKMKRENRFLRAMMPLLPRRYDAGGCTTTLCRTAPGTSALADTTGLTGTALLADTAGLADSEGLAIEMLAKAHDAVAALAALQAENKLSNSRVVGVARELSELLKVMQLRNKAYLSTNYQQTY